MKNKFAHILLLLILPTLFSACSLFSSRRLAAVSSSSIEINSESEQKQIKASAPDSASLSQDETIEFQNIDLSAFRSFSLHQGKINTLALSDDAEVAYTGGDDGIVYRSKLQNQSTLLTTRIFTADKPILALALSPNDLRLAVSLQSEVLVYDIGRGEFVNRLTRVQGRITKLTWDPRGELLALGLTNGDTYVWNLVDGRDPGRDSERAIELYRSHPSPVVNLTFHPEGRIVIVAHKSGKIYLWRLIRTAFEMGLRDPNAKHDELLLGNNKQELLVGSGVEDIYLSADASDLFVATASGLVKKFKIRGLVPISDIEAGVQRQVGITRFTAGKHTLLAASSRDKRIRTWCSVNGKEQLFAVTPLFDQVLTTIKSKESSRYLWSIQNSGNLLNFDANFFDQSTLHTQRLAQCQ